MQNIVALDDSIMRKGEPVTAGSKILEGFSAPFDAEVITRLERNGFSIAGRTQMDEFGLSAVGERAETPSGAVQAVASGAAKYALCNDVFGQVRRQAAESGVCYIHPTYGTVSRYGLIPLVSSMDQIGVVCQTPDDGFKLLSCLAGKDPKDGAMFPQEHYNYQKTGKPVKVGIPDEILDHFDVFAQLMVILGSAELSNNISRYDGVKFGYRAAGYRGVNDMYLKTRTEALGLEAKLMAILGAWVLSKDQYEPVYEKAMKIRRRIKDAARFDTCDVFILPEAPGGSGGHLETLALYALPQLAGLPSLVFSHEGQAIQLLAAAGNENALYTAWGAITSGEVRV